MWRYPPLCSFYVFMITWSWQSWQYLHSLWVIIIIIIIITITITITITVTIIIIIIIMVIIISIIVISIVTSWSLSSSQSSSNCLFKSNPVTSTKVQDKRPLSLFSTMIVSFQKQNKARSYPWKTTKIQDLHDVNNNEGFNIPISPGMKQGTSHYARRSYRSSAAMAQATGCYERPVLKRTPIHDSTGCTTKGDLSSEGNEIYNRGTCGERQQTIICLHETSEFRGNLLSVNKKWKRKKKENDFAAKERYIQLKS